MNFQCFNFQFRARQAICGWLKSRAGMVFRAERGTSAGFYASERDALGERATRKSACRAIVKSVDEAKNSYKALRKSGAGFTIIELLVAIFFLSVGIIGGLIAIQQALAYTNASSSRLTAVYLAQEGVEIVRNIRDGNWLQDVNWDTNLDLGSWEADYQTLDLDSDNYNGDPLLINAAGFYNYSSGDPTIFKREIAISDKWNLDGDPLNIPDQIKVTVTVYWEARGQHQILAQEILYNWRQ